MGNITKEECRTCSNADQFANIGSFEIKNPGIKGYKILPHTDKFCKKCMKSGEAEKWCHTIYIMTVENAASDFGWDISWLRNR